MIWYRVTRQRRCLICDHDSWCTYSNLGSCCMRLASNRQLKNGGWLHAINGTALPRLQSRPEPPPPTIDAAAILADWSHKTYADELESFAVQLGVTAESLRQLGCVRSQSHQAWGFPMFDGVGNTIGIRLRYDNGEKRAVRGSHAGLFVPEIEPQPVCHVAEGPTDCAALLSLGLYAIGRPSCSGGTIYLLTALRRLKIRRVVICADNDADKELNGQRYNPGIDGATRLQQELEVPSCLFIPPCKDIREALSLGITAQLINNTINNQVWSQPRKTDPSLTEQLGAFVQGGPGEVKTKMQFA